MSRYRFAQRYSSSLTVGAKGDEVDIPDEFAALVNNDAPGTLTLIIPVEVEPVEAEPVEAAEAEPAEDQGDDPDEAEPTEETRSIDSPPSDRMVKAAPQKRNDRESAQPIDKTTFKAVKDK